MLPKFVEAKDGPDMTNTRENQCRFSLEAAQEDCLKETGDLNSKGTADSQGGGGPSITSQRVRPYLCRDPQGRVSPELGLGGASKELANELLIPARPRKHDTSSTVTYPTPFSAPDPPISTL